MKHKLKRIRKKKNILKQSIIYILILITIFISPVFYQSIQNGTNFINDLSTYTNKCVNFLEKQFDIFNYSGKNNSLDELNIHYIDVGQGDSELIQINGKNILIDTGEAEESNKLINYLKGNHVNKIDALLITHSHTDHMGGATKILDSFKVDKIYMTNYVHTTSTYEDLLKKIKDKGLKITRAKKGVHVDMGENVKALILSPGKEYHDINASSIVLKLDYGSTSFLFSGDATTETEADILLSQYNSTNVDKQFSINVYKVAHHGSSTSNSRKFLKKLNAKLAIISAGKNNPYGHPHKVVMKRLKSLNIKILETSKLGSIVVTSDGENIWYKSKGKEKVMLK